MHLTRILGQPTHQWTTNVGTDTMKLVWNCSSHCALRRNLVVVVAVVVFVFAMVPPYISTLDGSGSGQN